MAVVIEVSDLTPFFPNIAAQKAQAMIEDALAQAAEVAPCILDPDFDAQKAKSAKSIIRGALLRWEETGSGGVTTQHTSTAGPISEAVTTATGARKGMFWPMELQRLRRLCSQSAGSAFSIDTFTP